MRDRGGQACAGIHCFSPVYSGHVSFATKDWPTWSRAVYRVAKGLEAFIEKGVQ